MHDREVEPFRAAIAKLNPTICCFRGSSHVERDAAIFRYRFKRREDGTADSSCYRFVTRDGRPAPPTPGWLVHENDVFEYGQAGMWNAKRFRLRVQDGIAVAIDYSNETRRRVKKNRH